MPDARRSLRLGSLAIGLLAAAFAGLAGVASASGPRLPLACPGPNAPLTLSTGTWQISNACSVTGVHLSGDADVLVVGTRFLLQGDLLLEGSSVLTITTSEYVIAQATTDQYHSQLHDSAVLDIRNAKVITNTAQVSNVTAFVYLEDDTRAHFEGCQLDTRYNWLLVYVHARATLEVANSVSAPTESYPRDDSTVRVTGANTSVRVVLLIPPDAQAALDDIPSGTTFTYQFGRGTPGNTGIGYLVDVEQSWVRWGVSSGPKSDLEIRNNGQPVTMGFLFALVNAPTLLSGLRPAGPLTQTFGHQNRSLRLDNAQLYPNGWQIYVQTLADPSIVKPVWIEDSQVNELGALENGIVQVRESTFQYAFLAAYNAGSSVRVQDSVINSQNVRANQDGVMEIADSTIWGSLLDAGGNGRIRLSNTELNDNVCHPGCLPSCVSFTGGNECNGFNPSLHVTFNVRDSAAVLGARIAPIAAPVPAGTQLDFVGDAFVQSPVASLTASPWELSVRPVAGGTPIVVASGGGTPQIGTVLGTLDTTGLAGEWIVRLEVRPPGEAVLAAERFFLVQTP